MILSFFLIVVWLAILLWWAEYLVRGAWSLSRKAWIPPLVIGLTIVAFWTSAPELIVNVFSALQWTTDLAFWNIIWSNLANILLILWVAWLFSHLRVNHSTVRKEIPFSLLAVLAIFIMANDVFLDHAASDAITRTDWLILLWFFAIFMYYTVELSRQETTHDDDDEISVYPNWLSWIYTLWWCVGLFLWGKLLVDNAVNIATLMGISERLIWLTIVAIWTSLPELATSVIAVKKWHTDIAIGNVVWSNIFNIFWILWVSSIIMPIPISSSAQIDIVLCILATVILFAALFIGKKHHLEKRQSAILFATYIAYMWYLIIWG